MFGLIKNRRLNIYVIAEFLFKYFIFKFLVIRSFYLK